MINYFIKSGMIKVFTETFEGKLNYVFVNLAQISTNNPFYIDINTCYFYYFPQVGFHLAN
jgi:hypothetical protein